MTRSYTLQFGIPSLDRLIGSEHSGVQRAGDLAVRRSGFGIKITGDETVSLCLIGGDGTGKSALAMHLAATYRHRTRDDRGCRVIYASTDLSVGRARRLWDNFALAYPQTRIIDPFDRNDAQRRMLMPSELPLEFLPIRPLLDKLDPNAASGRGASLEFLDLATNTAGDDWAFLNRLAATLRPLEEPAEYPHLLVIDAIEGLEVLVGRTDAYGERRERRSRVAQIVRAAAGKSHLVFLVEDTRDRRKVPEEFVSDAVIRLGFRRHGDYSRRVVKVEKVRGQGHVRGSHDLAIRSGRGSSTGRQINFDDPEVIHPKRSDRAEYYKEMMQGGGARPTKFDSIAESVFQSYVYVFPSLHHDYRAIMEQLGESLGGTKNVPLVHFGVRYLDELLTPPPEPADDPRGGEPGANRSAAPAERDPPHGIPANVPVALIGEQGTFKSRLSRAYLARAFEPSAEDEQGVAILLSTQTCDHEVLGGMLSQHGPNTASPRRVICRRLEVHNLPPAVLLHIVRQAVRQAQMIVFEGDIPASEAERRKQGHRIRLVFNNWTTFRDMHPEIAADRKILPNLLFFLQRESVATLIVANEDQGFTHGFQFRRTQDLHELTGGHVYTWHIPFFGEGRIAVSAGYRITAERRSHVIRELRPLLEHKHVHDKDDYLVGINPTFELFDGLEQGKPRYVDLKVYLYGDNDPPVPYVCEMQGLIGRLLYGDEKKGARIIVPQNEDSYESLRNFSELQGASRFPYTLVLQVDEFWAKSGSLQLSPRARYLEAITATSTPHEVDGRRTWRHNSHLVEDSLQFFQPTLQDQRNLLEKPGAPVRQVRQWRRLDFFRTVGYDLATHLKNNPHTVVKVPYTWDFGFLMCARQLWEGAAAENEHVRRVWEKLPRVGKQRHGTEGAVGWPEFLRAARRVAKFANKRSKFRGARKFISFAIAPEHQESLCCLLLEIWASQVERRKVPVADLEFRTVRHERTQKPNDPEADTLIALARKYRKELYVAVRMLMSVFPEGAISSDNRFISQKERGGGPADGSPEPPGVAAATPDRDVGRDFKGEVAVAARHWYASASDLQRNASVCDLDYVPVRLPGCYSVRGDWFLAIARGSRSVLMGDRAIDLLSTRRASIVRLQTGMGLPVRDAHADAAELWTAIWMNDRTGTEPRSRKPRRPHDPGPCELPTDRRVHYRELIELGGPVDQDGAVENGFRWLWRSRIRHYDRHSRILRRWLCGLLRDPSVVRNRDDFFKAVDEFCETLARGTIFDENLGSGERPK